MTSPGKGLLGTGIVGILISFVWWAMFYGEATRRITGKAQFDGLFGCLFASSPACDIIRGLARAAGYFPYEPFILWLSLILTGVGAVMSMQHSSTAPPRRPIPSGEAYSASIALTYDRAKWQALLKYDEELAQIAAKLGEFGPKWIDAFARDYLAINDKAYVPVIVQKLLDQIKDEESKGKSAAPPSGARWVRTIFETEYGIVFITAQRTAYFTNGSSFQMFGSVEEYRHQSGDISTWTEVTGQEKKTQIMHANSNVLEAIDADIQLSTSTGAHPR